MFDTHTTNANKAGTQSSAPSAYPIICYSITNIELHVKRSKTAATDSSADDRVFVARVTRTANENHYHNPLLFIIAY